MSNVDYDSLIPNNVGLASDRRLQRALERWHPNFIDWWKTMGPDGFQDLEVYLRTAIAVDPEGWARFRLCENAGISLGHITGAPGTRQKNRLWPA